MCGFVVTTKVKAAQTKLIRITTITASTTSTLSLDMATIQRPLSPRPASRWGQIAPEQPALAGSSAPSPH